MSRRAGQIIRADFGRVLSECAPNSVRFRPDSAQSQPRTARLLARVRRERAPLRKKSACIPRICAGRVGNANESTSRRYVDVCQFELFIYSLSHSLVHPFMTSPFMPSTLSSINPSIHSSTHPPVHQSIHHFTHVSIHPFIHSFIPSSIHPSTHSFEHWVLLRWHLGPLATLTDFSLNMTSVSKGGPTRATNIRKRCFGCSNPSR